MLLECGMVSSVCSRIFIKFCSFFCSGDHTSIYLLEAEKIISLYEEVLAAYLTNGVTIA